MITVQCARRRGAAVGSRIAEPSATSSADGAMRSTCCARCRCASFRRPSWSPTGSHSFRRRAWAHTRCGLCRRRCSGRRCSSHPVCSSSAAPPWSTTTIGCAPGRSSSRGGGHTLSFMSTWPGNSFWFDPEVPMPPWPTGCRDSSRWRSEARSAPRSPTRASSRRFVRFCGDHGWTATFYGVDDAALDTFAALRWQRLKVAEEAVLRPRDWNPTGKKWQDIRTAICRNRNQGRRSNIYCRRNCT